MMTVARTFWRVVRFPLLLWIGYLLFIVFFGRFILAGSTAVNALAATYPSFYAVPLVFTMIRALAIRLAPRWYFAIVLIFLQITVLPLWIIFCFIETEFSRLGSQIGSFILSSFQFAAILAGIAIILTTIYSIILFLLKRRVARVTLSNKK
jgi:hypothetical protein